MHTQARTDSHSIRIGYIKSGLDPDALLDRGYCQKCNQNEALFTFSYRNKTEGSVWASAIEGTFKWCLKCVYAYYLFEALFQDFNLKILNDNCSSVVKCKCTYTECECPIDSIKSNSDRQLYIKTKKKDVFIFFAFYAVNSISEKL